ncbi:MAG: hypothetical protein QXL22_04490 [Candidatus Nezhaarchaeales archaeon]
MPRKGLRLVTVGLIMLFIGFMLSLYLVVPRYSPMIESKVYTVELKDGEVSYLSELMNFSNEHGAVWGNVTVTSSINSTLYISLTHINGTKITIIVILGSNLTKKVDLAGHIIEDAFVVPESNGTLKYNFELFYREDVPLAMVVIVMVLIIVGATLGLRGLTLIILESGGV